MSATINTKEGTAMTTIDRERQRRIFALLDRKPAMTEDEAAAEIDAELAAEAAAVAERTAHVDEMAASMTALAFTCGACGGTRSPSSRDGLCGPCTAVNYILAAEHAADEEINGHTRREWVDAYRARRARETS
jgi:hypothetical protein